MAADKEYLRTVLRACRSALPAGYVARASKAVQQRLLDSAYYEAAASVVLYAAKDNEISTEVIFTDAVASGRRVLFPRVAQASGELLLVRVDGPAQLKPGAFGLLEPTGAEIVPVAELGSVLICVPGLAFTPSGHRLGRGGGYYDRLLAGMGPRSISAGLAFSFQVLDQLPESPGDQRLTLILTESTVHGAVRTTPPPARWADQGGVPRC